MSKPLSNKDKIGYVISMIFFAVCIIFFGLMLTFVTMLPYGGGQSKLFLIFLFPTITASIVVILVIMTVNKLTAKPDSSSKKTKISNKKPLLTAIVVGIAVIFTFALIWGSLLASSYTPPREDIQIYIKADGTIQPPTTQIKQEGSLYALKDDIYLNKFQIEKNDIILDGNGYQLTIVGPPRYKTSPAPGTFELSQVKNVTIQNLNLGETKLVILNSQHCNIKNNNFLSFEILYSQYIQISGIPNYSPHDPSGGLLLVQSANCIINKIHIDELKLVGSHHNKILSSNLTGHSDVRLWFEDSSGNLLFKNQIDSDVRKLFSMTGQTQNNLIVANTFTDYAYYEPTFNHNGTNTFYHNNFFNSNWLQSDPNFTQSKWDNGQTGNYWSNYQGEDQNNNGIGDTPHTIDQNNRDNYPLTTPLKIDTEVQPQLLPCNQTPNPYKIQNTQEDSPQTTIIAIIVIAAIIVVSLIFHKRKQIKN